MEHRTRDLSSSSWRAAWGVSGSTLGLSKALALMTTHASKRAKRWRRNAKDEKTKKTNGLPTLTRNSPRSRRRYIGVKHAEVTFVYVRILRRKILRGLVCVHPSVYPFIATQGGKHPSRRKCIHERKGSRLCDANLIHLHVHNARGFNWRLEAETRRQRQRQFRDWWKSSRWQESRQCATCWRYKLTSIWVISRRNYLSIVLPEGELNLSGGRLKFRKLTFAKVDCWFSFVLQASVRKINDARTRRTRLAGKSCEI